MPGPATNSDLPRVPKPGAPELSRLHHKYVRLGQLRAGVGVNSAEDVREPLRELAREFPGSLREIDVLSSERIQQRASALEGAALDGASEAPEWARVTHAYHLLMRTALWLKAELSAGVNAEQLATRVEAEFGVACTPRWIDRVKQPPRGRLNDLVFEALAAQFERSVAELRGLIFPRGDAGEPRADGVH
ncbi:MAG: hypothetical protein H6718_00260 [Polyangiaceae bacterium]|nr:hypothetical protein [Polyangiaceae bacterium]